MEQWKEILFACVIQWKMISLNVVLYRLCEAVGKAKMFCLSSGSLLSIVFGVRCIKVVTRKFLRNKGDRSGAAMAGRLEPFGSKN